VLIPPSVNAADIHKMGFRGWLADGFRQPGLKWFGWYFPRRFKVLGPVLYLLVILMCMGLIILVHH
jgi:hypothetical protein